MKILRMRIACWITKATEAHLKHVILNCFPQQKYFGESAPLLRHSTLSALLCI